MTPAKKRIRDSFLHLNSGCAALVGLIARDAQSKLCIKAHCSDWNFVSLPQNLLSKPDIAFILSSSPILLLDSVILESQESIEWAVLLLQIEFHLLLCGV